MRFILPQLDQNLNKVMEYKITTSAKAALMKWEKRRRVLKAMTWYLEFLLKIGKSIKSLKFVNGSDIDDSRKAAQQRSFCA